MDYVDTIIKKLPRAESSSHAHHNLIWGTQQPQWVKPASSSAPSRRRRCEEGASSGDQRSIAYYVRDPRSITLTWMSSTRFATTRPIGKLLALPESRTFTMKPSARERCRAHTRLYTNEYNVLQWSHEMSDGGKETRDDPYANWYLHNTQELLAAGGAVQGIGVQYYADLHDNTTRVCPHGPAQMAGAFQNLAVSGLPLCLTEFGMQRGHDTYDPACLPRSSAKPCGWFSARRK